MNGALQFGAVGLIHGPVCPNCHAVIQRRRPPYTIAELQGILQGAAGGSEFREGRATSAASATGCPGS